MDRALSVLSTVDVSRETVERLHEFERLVHKWNPVINLVSKSSLTEVWQRHILDSAQLFPHIPKWGERCVDLGSGGGFPAIVLAVISAELSPMLHFTLVESDQRKAAFLREAARLLDLKVAVQAVRIDVLAPMDADVLSARALSPLANLLESAKYHLSKEGLCLFSKGENYMREIDAAHTLFKFDCEVVPSLTDPKGVILKIHGIRNA